MAEFSARKYAYGSDELAGEATFAFATDDDSEYKVIVGTTLAEEVDMTDYLAYPNWYRCVVMDVLEKRENFGCSGSFRPVKNLKLEDVIYFPGDVFICDSVEDRDKADGLLYEGFREYCAEHLIQKISREEGLEKLFKAEFKPRAEVNPTDHQIVYHFATMQNGEGKLLPLLKEFTPSEARADEITEKVWRLVRDGRLKFLQGEPFNLISSQI